MSTLDNANPTIHSAAASSSSGIFGAASRRVGAGGGASRTVRDLWAEEGADDFYQEALEQDGSAGGDDAGDDIDAEEIFDLLRSITDPEHPLTLEQLAVVSSSQISFPHKNQLLVEFTPTIPHCSMATLIGLSLRVRLLRALPERYKVDIRVKQGSHQSEVAVNKQLNDKERVAAALENSHLLGVVEGCLATAGRRGGLPVA